MSYRPMCLLSCTMNITEMLWDRPDACVKWIMRKWPQTLSTHLLSLTCFIWGDITDSPFLISSLVSICLSHFVSLAFITAVSTLRLCVCGYLWNLCGEREETERTERQRGNSKGQMRSSSCKDTLSPVCCVRQNVIWGICHFNLISVLSAGHLAIRMGTSAGLSKFP